MARIRGPVRRTICANIRACRMKRFPGRGGSKKCAEMFGVSQQQWSPWETGSRTPDELRLAQLAEFFGVTVDYLCQEHPENGGLPHFTLPQNVDGPEAGDGAGAVGIPVCPFYRLPHPGPEDCDPQSLCMLAERFFAVARDLNVSLKLGSDDLGVILKPLLSRVGG